MDESLKAELQATLEMIPAFMWYAAPSGALQVARMNLPDPPPPSNDVPLSLIDIGLQDAPANDVSFTVSNSQTLDMQPRVDAVCAALTKLNVVPLPTLIECLHTL
jgi:hypothetical protein